MADEPNACFANEPQPAASAPAAASTPAETQCPQTQPPAEASESPTSKSAFNHYGAAAAAASGTAWVVAELCTASVAGSAFCGIPSGLIAAGLAVTSAALFYVGSDPPDLNYTVIPIPIAAPFVSVRAGKQLTRNEATAINALLSNEAEILG
jgi:hypothetical protein